jgi:maleate isomerase
MQVNQPRDIYGYRARIGYTSPPAATEVFPYEFYMMAPKGVTLVVSTLAIVDMDKEEVDRSYEISLRTARELARSQVDLVVLGGRPINRSRGNDIDGLAQQVEGDIKVPVTTSTAAQLEALRKLGAKNVAIAHPFRDDQQSMMTSCLDGYELNLAAITGAGYPPALLGLMPRTMAMSLARKLMAQAPNADTLWMPCAHWTTAESIELIEQEFGVNVVTAQQAITWHALRCCKVNDKIAGFGKLFREF